MERQRDISIDIAKGISIIAIVLGHIGFMYPQYTLLNTKDLLYLWHVPVFFILAGCFLKDEQLINPIFFFKKKFTSLYLKLLYFYIPAILLHNILISLKWYSLNDVSEYSLFDIVKQCILAIFFAGREPILGALWFVYVLFMALIGLSVISYCLNKTIKNKVQFQWLRFLLLLLFCIISTIASNKYGLTIRRFSNVFIAMFLIYIGKLLFNTVRIKFDNGYIVIACLFILFELTCMLGGVSLNSNTYKDLLQPTFGGIVALYIILYIGKNITSSHLGKYLAFIGRESFYIMALHFVGFKLCSSLLEKINVGGVNLSDLTPNVESNIFLLLLYSLFGVGIPLIFMQIFRHCKKLFS